MRGVGHARQPLEQLLRIRLGPHGRLTGEGPHGGVGAVPRVLEDPDGVGGAAAFLGEAGLLGVDGIQSAG
jgi:hypothetical protein